MGSDPDQGREVCSQFDCNDVAVGKCPNCGRWFCKKHLEAKLPVSFDWIKNPPKDRELAAILEKEWRREDAHPCAVYSQKWWEEWKRRPSPIVEWLDRERGAPLPSPLHVRGPKRRGRGICGPAVLMFLVLVIAFGVLNSFHEAPRTPTSTPETPAPTPTSFSSPSLTATLIPPTFTPAPTPTPYIEKVKTVQAQPRVPIVKTQDMTGLTFETLEPSEEELMIFNQINKERAKHHLGQLKLNNAITYVAFNHSKDMAERGYMDHDTPEGATVGDRLTANNIYFIGAGENIAALNKDELGETVSLWMGSPGHRANILSEEYNEVGVGVYCSFNASFNGFFCYATADFVTTVEEAHNQVLLPDYTTFFHLLEDSRIEPVKVRVNLTSTEPLDVYVLKSVEDWGNYVATGYRGLSVIYTFGRVTELKKEFTVSNGYGLVLDNNGQKVAVYDLGVEYLSV